MAEPLYLKCGSHGKQVAAVVCQHMLNSKEPVGVVENSSDPNDLQAWCLLCETMFLAQGEAKTDEFEAFCDRKMVCVECYHMYSRRHSRQG